MVLGEKPCIVSKSTLRPASWDLKISREHPASCPGVGLLFSLSPPGSSYLCSASQIFWQFPFSSGEEELGSWVPFLKSPRQEKQVKKLTEERKKRGAKQNSASTIITQVV